MTFFPGIWKITENSNNGNGNSNNNNSNSNNGNDNRSNDNGNSNNGNDNRNNGNGNSNNGNGNIYFELVQSTKVTYNSSGSSLNMCPCQCISLAKADQFIAPANSVIGLYSGHGAQLLQTNANNLTGRNYQFNGNQSNVNTAGNSNRFAENVAIRVHLSKFII